MSQPLPEFPSLPARAVEGREVTSRGMARLLLWMLRDFAIGRLDIEWPDGTGARLEGAQAGPHGQLRIHSPRLLGYVLARGEVGFGEAYMAGHWDSPDLSALLEVLYRNENRVRGPYERNALARLWGLLRHRARRNTRRGARRNIEYHYDLGNAFYAQWLDPSMAYSSAVFATPEQPLAEAQRHKFELLCERLQLGPGQHLLEIGCGWGGFAIHAAQRSGCRVTGITLSQEQLREAERRAAAAGLADRVQFRLQDYRDLGVETYDRVVSIEMYEAVGEAWWPTYFATIARLLAPGGVAALQGITIDPGIFEAYRRKRDFIQKYIFPGGMLSTPALLMAQARAVGLAPEAPAFFAHDYARTLACWHRGVLEHAGAIEQAYGIRFLRMWRYYLAYCECGFSTGSIDLMQLTLRKPAVAP
ncbi:SAM-dependent methyltransferase [Solimonas soli]|uniref:SAM-dependent methyltransferase n=1 Tax=Solimonas soli TaxID=413479 RepID=UPI0004B2FBA3|nr:cyclopropane-fatty-acyl-phospholipid synthase family protein [Solimonas soli]